MDIKFSTFSNKEKYLETFFDNYVIEVLTLPSIFCMSNLALKADRICRFCGTGKDASKFRDAAHVIPELLGNKDFFSDFECDECNHFFGKMENDLTNSLGILRTIYGTRGKNGIPTFKSPQELIEGRKKNFYGAESIKISSSNSAEDLKFNSETGEHKITYTKQSYTPLNVYKVLLKIALTILPEEYVEAYAEGFKFLMNGSELKFRAYANVSLIQVPPQHSKVKPIAFLFKRKDESQKLPGHSFALYYENLIYTFPLFFNQKDETNGCYKIEMDVPICPPLLFNKPEALEDCRISQLDLSSNTLRKGEKEIITMKINTNELEAAVKFNPETGEISNGKINEEDIAAIYLVRGDQSLRFPTQKS